MSFDAIEEAQNSTLIQLPPDFIGKSKGGSQIHTVLDIGQSAFDDEPPEVRKMITRGTKVITGRYPGHTIDLEPLSSDAEVAELRMISCDEVHAIVDEGGVDV
jgi:hypothetical protein